MALKNKYMDEVIFDALKSKKKVTLFLCRDLEGGFGVKVDGKIIGRNFAWETFEYPIQDYSA